MNHQAAKSEISAPRTSLVLATLFGIHFLVSADYQLLIPLLPVLSRDLRVSMSSLGWLFSVYALAAGLFNLLLGPLTDRLGRILFLRLGLLVFALLAIVTYAVSGFRELLSIRAGVGLTAGVLSTCTASFVGDFFPYQQRGKAMGTVLSAYFVALIVGVPLGAWVAQKWDWHLVFLLSFLGAIFFLAVTLWSFPPRANAMPRTSMAYFQPYRAFLNRGDTLAALLVSFSVSGGPLAFLTYISGYLDQAFNLDPLQISWLFVSAGVAAALSSPVSGWLSDRRGKRQIFVFSNSFLALPLLVLNYLPWGVFLIGDFFVISLCIAFRHTALHTLQTELVSREYRGSFLALRNTFSQMGIAVSIFVAGNLYSNLGYGTVTVFAVFLTLVSSALVYLAIEEPGPVDR